MSAALNALRAAVFCPPVATPADLAERAYLGREMPRRLARYRADPKLIAQALSEVHADDGLLAALALGDDAELGMLIRHQVSIWLRTKAEWDASDAFSELTDGGRDLSGVGL